MYYGQDPGQDPYQAQAAQPQYQAQQPQYQAPQPQYQAPQPQYQGQQPPYQGPPQGAYQGQQPAYQGGYQQPYPGAGMPLTPQQDAEANKGMSILAYIVFFVPLIAGTHKTSPFARFHTNQGTVLAITSISLSVVMSIISAILTALLFNPGTWGASLTISTIIGILWMVIGLAILALAILGIVNAAGGKMKPLPVIGKFKILK
jgi:uncharacterized membrane protein